MQTPSHTRFGYKAGPTSVGKGFEEVLEKRSLAGLVVAGLVVRYVSFGQIIRGKLEKDPAFERLHGATVRKGDLLPDEPAIDIFTEATDRIFQESEPDLVLVDGFCRSGPQISFAATNGFVDERDQFYFLNASIETCAGRFSHRSKQSNTQRNDQEWSTFYRRYHLHRDTVGNLRGTLLELKSSPQIIDIDADKRPEDGDNFIKAIPEAVHPAVLFHLLPLAFHQMVARKALVV